MLYQGIHQASFDICEKANIMRSNVPYAVLFRSTGMGLVAWLPMWASKCIHTTDVALSFNYNLCEIFCCLNVQAVCFKQETQCVLISC